MRIFRVNREKADLLEEQLRPKLSVVFKQGEQPYFQEAQHTTKNLTVDNGGRRYTYHIGLINSGSNKAENVNVRLVKINPCPNELKNRPYRLQFTNEPALKEIDIQNTINPVVFVDVFSFFRNSKGKFTEVEIFDIERTRKTVKKLQSYEIEIEVSSDNGGKPFIKQFNFDPQKDEKSMLEVIT